MTRVTSRGRWHTSSGRSPVLVLSALALARRASPSDGSAEERPCPLAALDPDRPADVDGGQSMPGDLALDAASGAAQFVSDLGQGEQKGVGDGILRSEPVME